MGLFFSPLHFQFKFLQSPVFRARQHKGCSDLPGHLLLTPKLDEQLKRCTFSRWGNLSYTHPFHFVFCFLCIYNKRIGIKRRKGWGLGKTERLENCKDGALLLLCCPSHYRDTSANRLKAHQDFGTDNMKSQSNIPPPPPTNSRHR